MLQGGFLLGTVLREEFFFFFSLERNRSRLVYIFFFFFLASREIAPGWCLHFFFFFFLASRENAPGWCLYIARTERSLENHWNERSLPRARPPAAASETR